MRWDVGFLLDILFYFTEFLIYILYNVIFFHLSTIRRTTVELFSQWVNCSKPMNVLKANLFRLMYLDIFFEVRTSSWRATASQSLHCCVINLYNIVNPLTRYTLSNLFTTTLSGKIKLFWNCLEVQSLLLSA